MQGFRTLGKNFVFPDYRPNYPREPSYRLLHYRAELRLPMDEPLLEGKAHLRIAPIDSGLDVVEIDAVEMRITSVKLDGNASYSYDGRKLLIYPSTPISEEVTVTVEYSARPRAGLYFILPDRHHPDRRPQAWSLGEPENNRYWLPIYDYPNLKTTSEMLITVPEGMVAISNGRLISVKRDEGSRTATWHWLMDKPHSTYLISIAVGDFSVIKEVKDGIELEYIVPKGREGDVARSFSKTADMIKFFSEYLGFQYPFERYAQVCVSEFIVGGMEHTTCTTLTDATLHDEHAHMDYSSDPLVAHELAHQWFGDTVTMSDWGNIWLNESFATFLENLYVMRDKGYDEFIYELRQDLKAYLEEYENRYSRPIVMRIYKSPWELFDAHSYPKGGLILNTLRNIMGDRAFRMGLKIFLQRFAFKVADTEDLRKCLEEAYGRSLEWFFDQFVYSAGHPSVTASYSWDRSSKMLRLNLKQSQKDDSPEIYRLPLEIAVKTDGGCKNFTIFLEEREQTVFLPCEGQPKLVCIDPDFKTFKQLRVERGVEEWIRVLEGDDHTFCRLEACDALGRDGSQAAVDALKRAVMSDRFWGVSSTAARALGQIRTESSKRALLDCLKVVTHPKVRRAIVDALGSFRDPEVAEALADVLSNLKESYYVRERAAASLGKSKWGEARRYLKGALSVPSHNYVITQGALEGMAELGGEEDLKTILQHTELGNPTPVRIAATRNLGKFPGRREVIDRLSELARDWHPRVRMAVVMACKELMEHRLLGLLDYMAENDIDDGVKRRAREVAKRIRETLEKGTEYKALREEVERVKEENRRLMERITRVESKGA